QRGWMRPRESRHDVLEGAQVKVQKPADGVVMDEDIVLCGERAEAARAVERIGTWHQAPPARLVPADDGTGRAEPAVTCQSPRHGSSYGWIRIEHGIERKDPRAGNRPVTQTHRAP